MIAHFAHGAVARRFMRTFGQLACFVCAAVAPGIVGIPGAAWPQVAPTYPATMASDSVPISYTVRLYGDEHGYRAVPANLQVRQGSTVRYVVASGGPYAIAFSSDGLTPTVRDRLDANISDRANVLTTRMLMNPGEIITVTLAGLPSGVYRWADRVHVPAGLRGSVTILADITAPGIGGSLGPVREWQVRRDLTPERARTTGFAADVERHHGFYNEVVRESWGITDHNWIELPTTGSLAHAYLAINSLGKPGLSATDAFHLITRDLGAVFPGGATGSPGQWVTLGNDFYLPLPMVPPEIGRASHVTVVSKGSFTFTLEAQWDHPLSGTATHGVFRDASGELWMFQEGYGANDTPIRLLTYPRIPLVPNVLIPSSLYYPVKDAVANYFTPNLWREMASNTARLLSTVNAVSRGVAIGGRQDGPGVGQVEGPVQGLPAPSDPVDRIGIGAAGANGTSSSRPASRTFISRNEAKPCGGYHLPGDCSTPHDTTPRPSRHPRRPVSSNLGSAPCGGYGGRESCNSRPQTPAPPPAGAAPPAAATSAPRAVVSSSVCGGYVSPGGCSASAPPPVTSRTANRVTQSVSAVAPTERTPRGNVQTVNAASASGDAGTAGLSRDSSDRAAAATDPNGMTPRFYPHPFIDGLPFALADSDRVVLEPLENWVYASRDRFLRLRLVYPDSFPDGVRFIIEAAPLDANGQVPGYLTGSAFDRRMSTPGSGVGLRKFWNGETLVAGPDHRYGTAWMIRPVIANEVPREVLRRIQFYVLYNRRQPPK